MSKRDQPGPRGPGWFLSMASVHESARNETNTDAPVSSAHGVCGDTRVTGPVGLWGR
jgi:hypothetical protein